MTLESVCKIYPRRKCHVIISYYHIFCCNMLIFACPIIANSQCWLFALIYPYLPPYSTSGICAVIIYLSHILHWLSSIGFYIAEKIFVLTNCKNKSLRELPLFNLQIFLFRVLYNDEIMTWNFQYRPWYQPSTHISPPASLSGLIWESRADTRANMENVM
jgi:hypothetical protein